MLENGGGTAAWDYDAAYRLTNWQRTGSPVRNNTMTYDAVGNRLTLDAAGEVTTYTAVITYGMIRSSSVADWGRR